MKRAEKEQGKNLPDMLRRLPNEAHKNDVQMALVRHCIRKKIKPADLVNQVIPIKRLYNRLKDESECWWAILPEHYSLSHTLMKALDQHL